jgi:hypothetical protein
VSFRAWLYVGQLYPRKPTYPEPVPARGGPLPAPHALYRSAKRPASSEHESVQLEPSGHREGAALAALKRDLLGEHDVSGRQLAQSREAQAEPRAATFIELADVRHGSRIDPVLLAGLATDNFEIAVLGELLPLDWRQPLPQSRSDRPSGVLSAPCLAKRALTALTRERSPGRDGLWRDMALAV